MICEGEAFYNVLIKKNHIVVVNKKCIGSKQHSSFAIAPTIIECNVETDGVDEIKNESKN